MCILQAFCTTRFPIIQYWPKVTHGPAHFLRAICNNGRHTRDKRVRSAHPTRVSYAAGAASRAHPTQMLYTWCAQDIRVANAI
jgi:hypothetical protein